MISVIIPVYNVEPYLRKCLDSVLNQTYRDLEILIVDDGSTDGSGKICDEYAERDERVRVFHTENRGLSAARNLGLDNATGDWIGFVDSDDWIEPEMYKLLIDRALETGTDVVECGCIKRYKTKVIYHPSITKVIYGNEALEALIYGDICTQVWNKVWKSHLFCEIRFPEGHYYEDICTTYKIIQSVLITGIPGYFYNYKQRKRSISQSHDKKNLSDYWDAHRQRYEDLKGHVNRATEIRLLKYCASAIAKSWAWSIKGDQDKKDIIEMSAFIRQHYPMFGYKTYCFKLRLFVFLAHWNNNFSLIVAYVLNQAFMHLRKKDYE